MMHLLAVVLLTLSGTTDDDGIQRRTVVLDPEQPRAFHEINSDLRAFFRREARADSKEDQVAAILDLCLLYEELKRDPRVVESPTLEGYRNRIWSRLRSSMQEIEQQMARAERRGEVDVNQVDTRLVEQVDLAAASFAGQMSLIGATYGGPARVFSQASGSFGGGVLGDYGEDLVRLIQNTIKPEFWDIVGGPGSIMYYQPLLALVVRATSEVHHDIGGAVDALRRAGGR